MRRSAGVVLAGALLVVIGLAFDTSELFVPGISLAVIGILVPPWIWLASRTTSVRRSIETDRVVEDQPLEARIEVHGGPLGAPGGEIIDPLAGGSIALGRFLLSPRRDRATEARVIARFARRGRRTLEPPALALRDPFGLMRTVRSARGPLQTVLVLPRIELPRWAHGDPGNRLDQQAGTPVLEALAAVDVDGLRPYRPGTPASRISWPALARGAGLLERRMQIEREHGPLVVLDVRCSGPSQRIDAAVRAAASLTHMLASRSGCELLLPGERRPVQIAPDMTVWPGVHVRLALLEGGPHAPPPSLSGRARSGIIFYVAAQREQLPAQMVRGGHRGAVLVLPSDVPPPVHSSARFEVSGCAGYVLALGGRLRPVQERAA